MNQTEYRNRWQIALVAGLYVISLTLPAVYQTGFAQLDGAVLPGYEMAGKLPVVMMAPAWWANPACLLGVVALWFNRPHWAWWFGLVATVLALSVLVFGAFPPDHFEYSHFHSGYYVWLSSMIALLLTASWQLCRACQPIKLRVVELPQETGGEQSVANE